MKRISRILCLLTVACAFLSGCTMSTVSQMYCLPERSEEYQALQTAINVAMAGKEYSSPRSGENQQTIQMTDLNGDGQDEYLVFAKGTSELPLHILIFQRSGDDYVLLDTIESYGSAFDQVEYVNLDHRDGYELVVGRQLADQVVRSVSVYSFANGQSEQLMSTNCTKFVPYDLDQNGSYELVVLRPGDTEEGRGVAEYYTFSAGVMERSVEASMSQSADKLMRIIPGTLNDGTAALYVASAMDENSIITDVFAIVDDCFTNVTFSNESGTSVQTLRNYFVYAEDIDKDGVIELPDLITMHMEQAAYSMEQQYLIRWYSMTADGSEVDKLYTYHNFGGGWYVVLDEELSERLYVIQNGTQNDFYLWDEFWNGSEKIMSIYTLTGQNREELAEDKIVLYQGDSVIYAAELDISSDIYAEATEEMIKNFHLIHRDWKTGET